VVELLRGRAAGHNGDRIACSPFLRYGGSVHLLNAGGPEGLTGRTFRCRWKRRAERVQLLNTGRNVPRSRRFLCAPALLLGNPCAASAFRRVSRLRHRQPLRGPAASRPGSRRKTLEGKYSFVQLVALSAKVLQNLACVHGFPDS
jgi:hypothetical protein